MITLNELQIFPGLLDASEAALSRLIRYSKVKSLEQDQTIINKGDRVSGVYLVISGCLKVYTIDANGTESSLYEIKPGESCLLAMNCVFSEVLYPAWVNCTASHTNVLVVPAHLYKELFNKEDGIRNFTFDVLSQRVFNIMSVLEEVLTYSLEQRLASLIIRKANAQQVLKMSHQAIASELGTAREVISRLLKKMERDGWVTLSRGKIAIKSKKMLSSCV